MIKKIKTKITPFATLASVGFGFFFALTLAYAEDPYSNTKEQSASEQSMNSSRERPGEEKTHPGVSASETCVDKHGVVIHRGEKDYEKCMKMEKKHKEMGGQVEERSQVEKERIEKEHSQH